MKINQKLFLGFTAFVIPVTLFSIFTIGSIKKEIKEVGDFHSPNLYLVQNLATKTTEAVEESFAYLVSGNISEKKAFLSSIKEIDSSIETFSSLRNLASKRDAEKEKIFENIILQKQELTTKAKELFNELETTGNISNRLFIEYKTIVDQTINSYKELIEIEKREVENTQLKAIQLIEQTLLSLIIIGGTAIIFSTLYSYYIAKSISQPVNTLKLAIIEVAKGNLDTKIEQISKDEIGDLAVSFSIMTQNLKKAREELLAVKDYTNNIITSMRDALIVTCSKGNIVTVNHAVCSMLKYEENELIGQSIKKICEQELPFNAEKDKSIKELCCSNVEKTYLAKDGNKIPVFFSSSLMFDEDKQVQGVVCVAQDISERKKAEVEIKNALEKEKELSELKSRFVTMASHEFRTPLSIILSSTELLEHYSKKWSEEKKLEHLHKVQAAVANMTQLLNDVLLIGKAESGKIEYNPTNINLVKFCQKIVEEIQVVAGTKHIIDFSSVGESNNVFADEKLLRHILTNLLTNAVKYSPQGGTVLFNLIYAHEVAVFTVEDRGIGIPLEDQYRLFESFHRGNNVLTIPGTGLGLAIVKKSVDLHGGSIAVQSKVEVGTTFTVTLPMNKQV